MYYCPNYGSFRLVGDSLSLNVPGLNKISGKCEALFRDETSHMIEYFIKEHRETFGFIIWIAQRWQEI
jgi:hypothetical protein